MGVVARPLRMTRRFPTPTVREKSRTTSPTWSAACHWERIAEQGEWSQVRTEDGTEAWIKTERIFTEDGARLATIHEDTRMFNGRTCLL